MRTRTLVGSLFVALFLGTVSATPAVAAPSITVNSPAALTGGKTVIVTASLSGATPQQLEAGVPWIASDLTLSISGWDVRVGYGLPGPVGEIHLDSNRGATAIFSLTPEYNGHYRFNIGVANPDDESILATSTVDLDVASPDLPSLPTPPTNPRLEVAGTAIPVDGSVAYFDTRLVADTPLVVAAASYNGAVPATTVAIEGAEAVAVQPGANASQWSQASQKWISSGEATQVTIEYKGDNYVAFYRDDLAFPLTYLSSAVYAVYQPESALRCATTGRRLSCHVGAYNQGYKGHATAPSPAVVSTRVQGRYRSTPTSKFSPWQTLGVAPLPMNGASSLLNRNLPARVARGEIEVRVVVLGFPKSQVTVQPARGASIDRVPWSFSEPSLLE